VIQANWEFCEARYQEWKIYVPIWFYRFMQGDQFFASQGQHRIPSQLLASRRCDFSKLVGFLDWEVAGPRDPCPEPQVLRSLSGNAALRTAGDVSFWLPEAIDAYLPNFPAFENGLTPEQARALDCLKRTNALTIQSPINATNIEGLAGLQAKSLWIPSLCLDDHPIATGFRIQLQGSNVQD
jgi:hypothetical protein